MAVLSMRSHRSGLITGLLDLISTFPKDSIVAEIGSYSGESSEIFAKSDNIKELHCIDAWTKGYDDNDVASKSNLNEAEFLFDKRMSTYSIVTKHKGWSYDVVNTFDNEYFDVVYIDSTHTYEGLKCDIELYTPKLKSKSIICGHDYSNMYPGIKKIVDELYGKPDKLFDDTSWAIYIYG